MEAWENQAVNLTSGRGPCPEASQAKNTGTIQATRQPAAAMVDPAEVQATQTAPMVAVMAAERLTAALLEMVGVFPIRLVAFFRKIWSGWILATALGMGQVQAEHALPNILWITSEDNGPHLGCYGDPFAVTPNLDRLAKRGTLFVNAHCQGPICGPSRASLLSGFYPHTTGVYQQPAGKAMERDRNFVHGQMVSHTFAGHDYRRLPLGKITPETQKLFEAIEDGKVDEATALVGQGAALMRHVRRHSEGHMLHMIRLMIDKHLTFDEAHRRALIAVGRWAAAGRPTGACGP